MYKNWVILYFVIYKKNVYIKVFCKKCIKYVVWDIMREYVYRCDC